MGGHTVALSLLKAARAEPSAVLRGSGEILQEDVFHTTLYAYFSGLCFDI